MKLFIRVFPVLIVSVLVMGVIFGSCKNEPAAPANVVTTTGVVLDEQGYIVPNAGIEVVSSNGAVIDAATTNELGAFSLGKIPQGATDLKLRLTHPDFKTLTVDLLSLIATAGTANPIVIQPMHLDSACARLSIAVSDIATHATISGAEVQLRRNGALVMTALTDITGHVTFSYLMPGTYNIRVSKSGYGLAYRDQIIQFCDSLALDMRLTAGNTHPTVDSCCHGVLTVVPRDSITNVILGSVNVQVFRANALTQTVITHPGAPAVFNHMCPGSYTIRLQRDGYPLQYVNVTMGCDETLQVTRLMNHNPVDSCCHGTLTVEARDSVTNALLDSVDVRVFVAGATVSRTVLTAAGVPAVFHNMCPGTYTVRLQKNGYALQYVTVTMGCDQNLTVTRLMAHVPPPHACCNGVLTVIARDSVTNAPLDGVNVMLIQANGQTRSIVIHSGQNAVFQGVCDGSYTIRLEKGGYVLQYYSFTMGCNEMRTVTRLMTPAPCCEGSITVVVRDSVTNTPVAHATVTLVSGNAPAGSLTSTTSGAVTFAHRCQGTYAITVAAPNRPPLSVTLTLGCNEQRTVNVVLP